MPGVKAVIFDLDDLLVNSFPLHQRAWRMIFTKYGFIGKDFHNQRYIGMRVRDIAQELAKELGFASDADALFREHEDMFLVLVQDELELLPGAIESLEQLKPQYRIALATSGTRCYVALVLEKFRLEEFFDITVTGDDVVNGKPDPEIYVKTVDRLGVEPGECVVLEDAAVGVQAAKAAGCRCIGVRNPHTPKQDLSRADKMVQSLENITPDLFASMR